MMCSIFGALLYRSHAPSITNRIVEKMLHAAHERGRDGRGATLLTFGGHLQERKSTRKGEEDLQVNITSGQPFVMIGNTRAEPTTEYVKAKRHQDQQPYYSNGWSIVHNGTIANDRELRDNTLDTSIDSAAIVELLARDEPRTLQDFRNTIQKLKGSFAILAFHEENPQVVYAACNYRPVWYGEGGEGVYFASTRRGVPAHVAPQMLTPYTVASFSEFGITSLPLYSSPNNRALVVCSGGLDSVVSAAWAKEMGYDVELIHFLYGSRAEGPEVKAVQAVAEHLGVRAKLFPLPVYSQKDSPLLDPNSPVAGGEEGAEFAHEWVPARNLLLLSVATAYAEANGFNSLILGNNMEEAGAYPDNEPEFIDRFNDLLPFAVGDGFKLKVMMPVGNMMKHEIVALGNSLGAPMHLTWSCYRAGEVHCGSCGPCYMRRKAFEITGLEDPIAYKEQE
jgi:7-cyano-7-deazaguanine synthase